LYQGKINNQPVGICGVQDDTGTCCERADPADRRVHHVSCSLGLCGKDMKGYIPRNHEVERSHPHRLLQHLRGPEPRPCQGLRALLLCPSPRAPELPPSPPTMPRKDFLPKVPLSPAHHQVPPLNSPTRRLWRCVILLNEKIAREEHAGK
ncbi:Hypothetical predicted protein, partial [Marmota monax]